ncbi:MAG: penicillin-binding protein 1A, partial [Enterobacterales bacterium]
KGPTRLRNALKSSTNLVSIRLLNAITPKYAVDYLENLGFDRQRMPEVSSLALGTADFTPLEVATGFAIFANGGYRVNPYFIHRIEDSNGNILFEEQPQTVCEPCDEIISNRNALIEQQLEEKQSIREQLAKNLQSTNLEETLLEELIQEQSDSTEIDQDTTQVSSIQGPEADQEEFYNVHTVVGFIEDINKPLTLSPELPLEEDNVASSVIAKDNVFIIDSMLKDVIHRGTASAVLRRSKSPLLRRSDLAGKTGTTNDAKDAWFSGYNGDYVATAWVGYSDYSKGLGNQEFGGKAALPIWQAFMETALKGLPNNSMKQPSGLVTAKIDPTTGLLAPAGMAGAIFEIFRQRYMPTEFANSSVTDPFNDEKAENEDEETIF